MNSESTVRVLSKFVSEHSLAPVISQVWNYDRIVKYEQNWFNSLSVTVQNYLKSHTSQRLDYDQRLFVTRLYLNQSEEERAAKKQNVAKEMHQEMFTPRDMSTATPYNCWFLRFPECAPHFPFHQLKTTAGYKASVTVRGTFSASNSHPKNVNSFT